MGFVNHHDEVQRLGYRATDQREDPYAEPTVVNLSGGNQQKVVLAKWLMTIRRC